MEKFISDNGLIIYKHRYSEEGFVFELLTRANGKIRFFHRASSSLKKNSLTLDLLTPLEISGRLKHSPTPPVLTNPSLTLMNEPGFARFPQRSGYTHFLFVYVWCELMTKMEADFDELSALYALSLNYLSSLNNSKNQLLQQAFMLFSCLKITSLLFDYTRCRECGNKTYRDGESAQFNKRRYMFGPDYSLVCNRCVASADIIRSADIKISYLFDQVGFEADVSHIVIPETALIRFIEMMLLYIQSVIGLKLASPKMYIDHLLRLAQTQGDCPK